MPLIHLANTELARHLTNITIHTIFCYLHPIAERGIDCATERPRPIYLFVYHHNTLYPPLYASNAAYYCSLCAALSSNTPLCFDRQDMR